jgi:hypothetical protein
MWIRTNFVHGKGPVICETGPMSPHMGLRLDPLDGITSPSTCKSFRRTDSRPISWLVVFADPTVPIWHAYKNDSVVVLGYSVTDGIRCQYRGKLQVSISYQVVNFLKKVVQKIKNNKANLKVPMSIKYLEIIFRRQAKSKH